MTSNNDPDYQAYEFRMRRITEELSELQCKLAAEWGMHVADVKGEIASVAKDELRMKRCNCECDV